MRNNLNETTIGFRITTAPIVRGGKSDEEIEVFNDKNVSNVGHSRYCNRKRIEEIQEQIRLKQETEIGFFKEIR